jgi:hypothetical protein
MKVPLKLRLMNYLSGEVLLTSSPVASLLIYSHKVQDLHPQVVYLSLKVFSRRPQLLVEGTP